MRLNPGRLKKRIEIIGSSRTQLEDGTWTEPEETVVHRCWAQFSRTSGNKAETYGETIVRFLIRTPAREITRGMTVHYAGGKYEIRYVNDYADSRDYTEIIAKELGTWLVDRTEVLTLIQQSYEPDEIGQMIAKETSRDILAAARSVELSELADAGKMGLNPAWKMEILPSDYHGEELAEYQGVRYSIYRTYRKNLELLELYLERRAGDGD